MIANLTADFDAPDLRAQAHDITRRQMQQWFDWMDRVLDIHRSNFVFREPTENQLREHELGLKLAIRTCNSIYSLIADPDFADTDLLARIRIRMRQLEDAYFTLHDSELSPGKANQILQQIFPDEQGA
jgi:hypothetical protein